MKCEACAFETERLLVREWHSPSALDLPQRDLAGVVADMLTEVVTRSLPPSWQDGFSVECARRWIEERDDDGTTLLVVDRSTRQAVGLMILFEMDAEAAAGGTEVRLGYLLAEPAWGKGLASELVQGFVAWCRGQAAISSLAGGVEGDNPASRRVLEKNDFQPAQGEAEPLGGEQIFRLRL